MPLLEKIGPRMGSLQTGLRLRGKDEAENEGLGRPNAWAATTQNAVNDDLCGGADRLNRAVALVDEAGELGEEGLLLASLF